MSEHAPLRFDKRGAAYWPLPNGRRQHLTRRCWMKPEPASMTFGSSSNTTAVWSLHIHQPPVGYPAAYRR